MRTLPHKGHPTATSLDFLAHTMKTGESHLLAKYAEEVVGAIHLAHKQGVEHVEGHDIVGKQMRNELVFAWALGCVAQPII